MRFVLAAFAVVAALVVGLWFWSGVVAPGYWSSIVLGTAWFVVVSAVAGKLTKGRGGLQVATRATMAVCSLAAIGGFYWTSVRETTVDEDIVVGVAASKLGGAALSEEEAAALAEVEAEERALAGEGGAPAPAPGPAVEILRAPVQTRGHSARGRAAVVRLPDGGRVLTLSGGFRIDPGPKVEVVLVPADADGVDGGTRLGGLKGSKGDQQYEIPDDVDVSRLSKVVFWCVPFTTVLAVAELRPA